MLMDTVGFLSKSRGYKNLSLRIVSIVRRFGVGARKFERLLLRFGALTKSLGCRPTFAITAVTLKRHPRAIRELCRLGVEFMVHGYIHTDYAVVPHPLCVSLPDEVKTYVAQGKLPARTGETGKENRGQKSEVGGQERQMTDDRRQMTDCRL